MINYVTMLVVIKKLLRSYLCSRVKIAHECLYCSTCTCQQSLIKQRKDLDYDNLGLTLTNITLIIERKALQLMTVNKTN